MLSSCAISRSANELLRTAWIETFVWERLQSPSSQQRADRKNQFARHPAIALIRDIFWNGIKLTRSQSTVTTDLHICRFYANRRYLMYHCFAVRLFLPLAIIKSGRFMNKAINFRLTSDSFWVFFCLSSKKHREWHATRLIVNEFAWLFSIDSKRRSFGKSATVY